MRAGHSPRVLLLSAVFPPRIGGSGRWLYEMYRRFPREQVLVLAGGTAAGSLETPTDIAVERVPLDLPEWGCFSRAGMTGYRRAWAAMASHVKEYQPTVVHAAVCLPEGALAWWIRQRHGIPYVCYAHGEELNFAASSRELTWIVRRVFSGAQSLVANSHNTKAMLTNDWGVAEHRIHVVHPGVDSTFFRPAAPDRAARAALGWTDRAVVLSVGRLDTRKGHDRLIEALPIVQRAVPNVLYAIVGEGQERRRLEALTLELGLQAHVQFLGAVGDTALLSCYQQCDLAALPNRQVDGDIEGFGMVLVEAQACGRPVIAGASGGTGETMRPHVTGETVACETPELLARVLIDLLNDPERRATMGGAGRVWAEASFAWPRVAAKAARLFNLPLRPSSEAPVE